MPTFPRGFNKHVYKWRYLGTKTVRQGTDLPCLVRRTLNLDTIKINYLFKFFFRVNDLSCLYLNNSKQGEKISQFATKSTEKILEDSFSSFTVVTN